MMLQCIVRVERVKAHGSPLQYSIRMLFSKEYIFIYFALLLLLCVYVVSARFIPDTFNIKV